MATVPMPDITSYHPNLPTSVITEGKLSAVQLEAIVIAGMQNSIILPSGAYSGALIGDGTGVGKGRISAGILWDNYRQGRRRVIWVSEKWDLMDAAINDFRNIGATELTRGISQLNGKNVRTPDAAVKPLDSFKYGKKIEHDGVIFTTYSSIIGESAKTGEQRVQQIEDWLRGNDDGEGGYILFDEAHKLKNAVAGQGGQESETGRKVKELLERMPKLRTASLSATAATDVVNLGYLDRLGQWGAGTAFPRGFPEFQNQIGPGGLAAMELIARELKAQGKYVSRTLSYKGVTYSQETHNLNPDQKALYRTAANAWASVVQSAEATIEQTTNGGGRQKGRFMALFAAAQQRFFGLLITALKTPTCIELANKALADGKSVVITLVNTNEAAQEREKAKRRDSGDDEDAEPADFDFGPKEMLVTLVRQNYPVQQYSDDVDSSGKPVKVPVYTTDESGRNVPVINPAAVEEREALIAQIDRDLHMPENPLDSLVNALGGTKAVAEITGRKERYDSSTGKFVPRGDPKASKDDKNLFEMRDFQNGTKRVAILSSAGGTGISLHAGNDVKNQQKRYHITLQVGWSADKAQQMLGRTHRTNQKHPPEYVFLISDLAGEQRFVSTILRRLGSLGALSKGQKDAAAGSAMGDSVNIETEQGKEAANSFYVQMLRNIPLPGTDLTGMQILHDLRVLKPDAGGGMTVPIPDRTNVTKLLNRLLAIDPDHQRAVYKYYFDIFNAAVDNAIARGTLDTGVKTLPGDEIEVKESRVIATDPKTGAKTFYYPVDSKVKTNRVSPEKLDELMMTKYADRNPVLLRKADGKLALAINAPPTVHADGRVEPSSYYLKPHHGGLVKATNAEIGQKGYKEVAAWAQEEVDKAQSKVNDAQRSLDRDQRELTRATESGRVQEVREAERNLAYWQSKVDNYNAELADNTRLGHTRSYLDSKVTQSKAALEAAKKYEMPADSWQRRSVSASKKDLDEQQAALAPLTEILKDPQKWAREQWKAAYDAAPTHNTYHHHLIGGAVLRFWNPLKEAAFIRNSIYTTTDSKTGQRVVGIDVPPARIRALLDRISGGRSTVDTQQLHNDVMINNMTYTLENNIQVRRGRVARENVIQLIPPNQDVGRALTDMGVLYEKGITPVYYVPNRHEGAPNNRTQAILDRILGQYPVAPDQAAAPLAQRGGEEEEQQPLLSRSGAAPYTGFYSQLERTIEEKMPKAAPAVQVEGIVRSAGVKADELRDTGLDAWFRKRRGQKVSKQDVLDYLRSTGNPLRKAEQMFAAGSSLRAIGTALHVDHKTVSRWLDDIGVVRKSFRKEEALKADAVRLYREGKSQQRVADELGVNQASVGLWVKAAGEYSRTKSYTDAEKAEILRLYVEGGMSGADIAQKLNVPEATVTKYVRLAGGSRSRSEAAVTLRLNKPEKLLGRGWGKSAPYYSEKGGGWNFGDSLLEIARMSQLDEDPAVISWTKRTERVPYGNKQFYLPDFLVQYADGRKEIEEVKPAHLVNNESVQLKAQAARAFFKDKGIGYRLITEDEIGKERYRSVDRTKLQEDAKRWAERAGQPLFQHARLGGPRWSPGSNMARLGDEAQAHLGKVNGYPVVYVNRQGMALLAGSMLVGRGEDVYGMAVSRSLQERAVANIEAALPALRAKYPERARNIESLLDKLARARKINPRHIVLAQAGPEVTDETIDKIIEEELDHIVQMEATGDLYSNHVGREGEYKVLSSPAGKQAVAALHAQGYKGATGSELVLEIGVRLMRPGRYKELGLTAQQAEDLAIDYLKALKAKHGDEAVAPIKERVYNAFGGQLRGRDKQGNSALRFGQPAPDRGTSAKDARRGGRGGSSKGVAKDAGNQGTLFAKRVAGPPNQDLFPEYDSDEQRAAEETAQQKLGADRLTAEFNSPTRGKIKPKKTSATPSLFGEDEPEQEALFSRRLPLQPVPPEPDERPRVSLSRLNDWAQETFGPKDAPKINYTGLGALKRSLLPGQNLAEVEKASRAVFESALPAASPDAITSTILQSAVPAIRKALAGSGHTWDELRLYYTDSRLQGLEQRWKDFAQQIDTMTPEDFLLAMQPLPGGTASPFLGLLDHIQGRQGLPQNLAQTAASLADKQQFSQLKNFLAIAFEEAANRVASVMDPADFAAFHDFVQNDPKGQESDRLYGELVEKSMADTHRVNEGVFSDALGPANRYIPLIPMEKPPKPGPGRRLAHHKPANASNAFATGLSEGYTTEMEPLSKRMTYSNRSNYKAALIQSMRDSGWAQPEAKSYRTADNKLAMTGPDMQEYMAAREETQQARTLIQNGKVTHLPAKFEVMPLFMERGLRATLDREPMDPDAVVGFMRWANMLTTKGPLELVFHSGGLMGALYANTPFLGDSGLDKALSLPLAKWFGIRAKLANIDTSTPENVKKLHELALAGALPAKSGKVTYSKEYAETTGAKRERASFAPLLYGPQGIDARARILMYDIFQAAYPNGTKSEMYHFVNQLGNYTPELQGALERALKQAGIGPFATAGMTRIVNSIHTIGGTGPATGGSKESKIWWWFTSSMVIALAAWVLAHKFLTGKYPLEDKASKLFQVPVQTGHGWIGQFRHSKLGNGLWGKGPEAGYINFAMIDNPLALRGARAIGLANAYQTHQAGGNAGQVFEAAQTDVMNSFAHPVLGPAVRAAIAGLTGEESYITGLRDRGQVGLRFYPAVPPKTKPGLPYVGARAWAAAKQLNGFYTEGAENLAGLTGLASPADPTRKGNFWWNLPFELLTPGLVTNASNPYARAKALAQDRAAEAKFK